MNILEKIVKEANEGGLARIEKAVECAENVSRMTKEYSEPGPQRKSGNPVPPTVSAKDIMDEMQQDSREQLPMNIIQEETPYLTEDSSPLIERKNDEHER